MEWPNEGKEREKRGAGNRARRVRGVSGLVNVGRSVLPQRGSEAEGAEMKRGFLSWVAAGVGVVELVR